MGKLLALSLAIQISVISTSNGVVSSMPATICSAGQFVTALSTSGVGSCAPPTGAPITVVLPSDITNATTSFADLTGLTWNLVANTRYDIECKFIYSANATTTGIGISWVGPASPTLTGGIMLTGITAATPGATTIIGNDNGGVTTASVATAGNFATFHGIWSNGANAGSLTMRVKSEVAIAGAIVVKAGSKCTYFTF